MKYDVDVAIVGAGPAGTSCALALKNSGLSVALVDKATFPRDKVCGDAIPGPTFRALRALSPELEDALFALEERHDVKASKVIAPNGKSFALRWYTRSYNAPRLHFDNFLLELVKTQTATTILENFSVKTVQQTPDAVQLIAKDDQRLTAKMIVGCDGANSPTARQLADFTLHRKHHCAAVRAYYRNVADVEAGMNEFYILKKHLPGYFWLFPVQNGVVNIGFGMLSHHISRQQLNLKKSLSEIVTQQPLLAPRFAEAEQLGKTQGFGLPLGSRKPPISGHRFLLAGDAASLIDPLQGHGIDKAVISAILAAQQVQAAFAKNRFDADFLQTYDRIVFGKLDKDFQRNYRLMRFVLNKPWLLNAGINLANTPLLQRWIRTLV